MSGRQHKKMGVLASANTVVLVQQRSRRRLISLLVGIVFIIVGGILLRTQTDLFTSNSNGQVVQEDYTQFVQQASQLLSPEKVEELGVLVEQVKSRQGYETSTDVMYIVVTYYINRANETEARANMTKLRAAYKPEVGYSKELLKVQPLSLDQLEARITFMANQIKQFETNAILMPMEPPQ
jgi:hypothetical protein